MDLKKGMTQLLSESLINIRVKEIYPIYLLNSIPNKST